MWLANCHHEQHLPGLLFAVQMSMGQRNEDSYDDSQFGRNHYMWSWEIRKDLPTLQHSFDLNSVCLRNCSHFSQSVQGIFLLDWRFSRELSWLLKEKNCSLWKIYLEAKVSNLWGGWKNQWELFDQEEELFWEQEEQMQGEQVSLELSIFPQRPPWVLMYQVDRSDIIVWFVL